MTSRQYKRKMFIKRFLWITLTAFPLPFIKIRFKYSYSLSNSSTGSTKGASIIFDNKQFLFEGFEKKSKEDSSEKSKGELQNPAKEFNAFRKLLVKHGYFTAVSGLMADYDGMPSTNLCEEFELTFQWTWSDKNFHSIGYVCDVWYPMEYDDREQFDGFMKFLFDLCDRCRP